MVEGHFDQNYDEKGNEDLNIPVPENQRYLTALGYNTYCLAVMSQVHDKQVAKQVLKWASRLHLHMKAQLFDAVELCQSLASYQDLN